MILLYLLAIVASDLLITHFGVVLLPFTSFFLIPFDLVARDVLHDKWRVEKTLVYKMPALILAGSLISYLLNSDAKNVALGSFCAFLFAGLFAGVVYQILKDKPRMVKMNVANLVGACVDSFIFQKIAFGEINLSITILQWTLKFVGGFMWSYIFVKFVRKQNEN